MGDVVAFREIDGRARRRPPPLGSSAEILFFTGVRYERFAEPAPAPDKDVSTGRPDSPSGATPGSRSRRRRA